MLETFATVFGIAVSCIWLVYLIYSIMYNKAAPSVVDTALTDSQEAEIQRLTALLEAAHNNTIDMIDRHQEGLARLDLARDEWKDSIVKQYEAKLAMVEQAHVVWRLEEERKIRKDANDRQRSTMRGQSLEHLAPLTLFDTYVSDDARFIGNPVDYLFIHGLSDVADGVTDEIREIMLMDVKTGKATLSKVQRRMRDAVIAGKVSFAVYNIETHEMKTWKQNDNTIRTTLEE